MITMLNKEQNLETSLCFALGKLAGDDGFCTGAGFIKQKYVSFGFSISIGKIQ
jgi:hypothetical protein